MTTDLAQAPAAENQLEQVRVHLGKMNKEEWAHLALEAGVNMRTFYNLINPVRKPGYDTVYRVFAALQKRTVAEQ